MGLAETVLKYFEGKGIVVVCAVKEEEYLQEITGVLVHADEACVVVQEEGENLPTVVNMAFVVWVTEDRGENNEDDDAS